MRVLLLFIGLVVSFNSISQSIGEINANTYTIDYDKAINDARKNREDLDKIYVKRYKGLQDKYLYSLGLNAISNNPKQSPRDGKFEAVVTDGYALMESIIVECANGFVTSVTTTNGQSKSITQSTPIDNFRAVIKGKNGERYEVIFKTVFD